MLTTRHNPMTFGHHWLECRVKWVVCRVWEVWGVHTPCKENNVCIGIRCENPTHKKNSMDIVASWLLSLTERGKASLCVLQRYNMHRVRCSWCNAMQLIYSPRYQQQVSADSIISWSPRCILLISQPHWYIPCLYVYSPL